jgi:hypothetical protein
MWKYIPPKGDQKWFVIALIAGLVTALVVSVGTWLITGGPSEGAAGPGQAMLAGSVIFVTYWMIAATAGYFGLKAMPLIMGAGIIIAVFTMLLMLTRPGDTGWDQLAAVAAFIQITVLAIIASVVSETGVYVWDLIDSRKVAKALEAEEED